MALLRVFAVLAFVAVVSAATNFTALVEDAEVLGTALPTLLKQQWAAKMAQQTKNLTAAKKTLEGQFTGESLKGVTEAFQVLNQTETKILANLTTFVNLQITETTEMVKNYTTLLNARLASKSTKEEPIHYVRGNATNVMNSWVPLLAEVHENAHQAFESVVREQAVVISKNYSNPIDDEVRVAITNAGIQLLNVLVQEQNDDIALLTSTQFNIFQNFFQKAEDALIQLLVAAKNNQ